MKKLMLMWKELDADNNGTLDYDKFVEIFQRTGHYLQYQNQTNPRDQMALILSGFQENAPSCSSAHTLMQLAKHHVSNERRPLIEFDAMQHIPAECPTTLEPEMVSPSGTESSSERHEHTIALPVTARQAVTVPVLSGAR